MRRFFTFALGALAMLAVALVAMFITMRIAIHGREALVPSLTGLSVADADAAAGHVGLRLTVENRFYSEVPAGRVLAQDPAPGSRVRRDWAVRVTESLGAQRISVPDLTGESERVASVSIRRLALEPGAVARLAVPGDADVVIAQTPVPNSAGADSPRVSLLVSDPASAQPQAYVMPQLVGLSYSAATTRAAAAGLHLEITPQTPLTGSMPPVASSTSPTVNAAPPPTIHPDRAQPMPLLPSAAPPAVTAHPGSIVTAQTPQAGRRVQLGDAVHIAVEDAVAQPLAAAITRAN